MRVEIPVRYDRQAAVEYAGRHWDAPSPRFANMDTFGGGGDCTNFTSQCLLAGGWPMDYRRTGYYTEWWYRRIGADRFDARENDWWSCTWSIPENQYHYLSYNYGAVVDLKRHPEEVRRLQLGDIIYYDWRGTGRLGHSSIVTSFDRFGRPLVTYRTLSPRPPIRNRLWDLRFRADARRILAVLLPEQALAPRSFPNWNALTPCESARINQN